MVKIVCKLCDYAFDNNEELIKHIEMVHKIKVKREEGRISVRKIE